MPSRDTPHSVPSPEPPPLGAWCWLSTLSLLHPTTLTKLANMSSLPRQEITSMFFHCIYHVTPNIFTWPETHHVTHTPSLWVSTPLCFVQAAFFGWICADFSDFHFYYFLNPEKSPDTQVTLLHPCDTQHSSQPIVYMSRKLWGINNHVMSSFESHLQLSTGIWRNEVIRGR